MKQSEGGNIKIPQAQIAWNTTIKNIAYESLFISCLYRTLKEALDAEQEAVSDLHIQLEELKKKHDAVMEKDSERIAGLTKYVVQYNLVFLFLFLFLTIGFILNNQGCDCLAN